MFQPRKIASDPAWQDDDGVKIYAISARNGKVEPQQYLPRLAEVKATKATVWATTPAFAIFHDGASCQYLVLGWWGNDNELFTSVSAKTESGWVEDPMRFSFCVWDLEVFWHERNAFIECVYCAQPDLAAYRRRRYAAH